MFDLININLDLLAMGISIAAIGLLGFGVYFNNKKSFSNRAFLFFCLSTIGWSVSDYLSYKFNTTTAVLWSLRVHIFIATWDVFLFFTLSYIFPKEKIIFPVWFRFFLLPAVIFTSLLSLTPFIFSKINTLPALNQVAIPEEGFGIILFSLLAMSLVISGIILLIQKSIIAHGTEKKQLVLVTGGMFFTACLILIFNLILPVFFDNTKFIPFAPLFLMPFILLISYAIYKHKLFNFKIVATAFIAFLISAFSFVNVVYSKELSAIIINTTAFTIILLGSIQLLKAMLSLEDFNERLQQKVAEQTKEIRKAYEVEKQARIELERLNQNKNDFIIITQHHLRTPLAQILWNVNSISSGLFGAISSELGQAISNIDISCRRLVKTLNTFLDITQMKIGMQVLNILPINIREVARDVLKEFEFDIKKKNITVSYKDGVKVWPDVLADTERVKDVFSIIVDNAIKYNVEGGTITVETEQKQDMFIVSVGSSGIGLSVSDKAELFKQSFFRSKEAKRVHPLGMGVGLLVAKTIIEAHHGKISVESRGEGKGIELVVQLPLT